MIEIANRTREIRLSGMKRGGLAETRVMVEIGTHCTNRKGARIGNSPLKTARAVFLSQRHSVVAMKGGNASGAKGGGSPAPLTSQILVNSKF
jgi:hypothetical protein